VTGEHLNIPLYVESVSSHEGSQLTSIAELSANEQTESEEVHPSDNDEESDHRTIRKIPEEFNTPQRDQEQSFTTAPGSLGPSVGPMEMIQTPAADKGKGHERDPPPHLESDNDEWEQLANALDHCETIAKQGKVQAIENRQELENLRSKVMNSYNWATYAISAISEVRMLYERLRTKTGKLQRSETLNSPHAMANRTLFAERGSDEESLDYNRCLHAQACFVLRRTAPADYPAPRTE
jgi:hypothetical protein